MTTKQAVIEIIQRLPDDTTLADIMAELYFRQKVDAGFANWMPAREWNTTRRSGA